MIDTIKLIAGHSLIVPHTSSNFKWCKDGSCKLQKPEHINQFGLYEKNSLGFNDYYVNVKPEDLVPQDGELIFPIYRALSETVVRKWAPIDFSKPGVLKASLNKLVGATIFVDHDVETDNTLGSVKGTSWQDGYRVGDLDVPAGINATLQIDGKSHPTIARGIAMDPPAYHSVSVTVSYKWEWSHPQLDSDDMWALWGTFADNNGTMELVRRIVTEIVMYSEISLVPLGADPFARLLKDGVITNPDFAKDRSSLSELMQNKELMSFASVDYKSTDQFGINSTHFINPNNNDDMNISEFMESLGLGKETTEAQLKDQLTSLQAKADTLAKLQAKKEGLNEESLQELIDNQKTEEEVAALKFVEENSGVDNLKDVIQFFNTSLEEKRTKAVNFLKLAKGDDAKEAIIETVKNSNGEALDSFLEQYKAEYEEKVPLTCSSCGSHEISRKSSEKEKLDDTMSLKEQLLASKRKESIGRIHGSKEKDTE